jgi:cytidine deaminase
MGPRDPVIQRLRARAVEAAGHAYAPYSHFPVGAAVLTADGEVFAGANVENASYSLTICAERNAIFQAVARGARKINALVVYTPTARPVAPCGACRQVLIEFGPDAEVFSFCAGEEVLYRTSRQLLPDSFGPDDLDAPTGR